MSRWITFDLAGKSRSGKTRIWYVRTRDNLTVIGMIRWYGRWRRYVYEPAPHTVYEQECLRDIASFIEERTSEQKNPAQTTLENV